MDDGLRMVEVGACSAWPLPGDPTCAGVARRLFKRAAAGLVLEPALVDDGVTMVSELAANTLHVQRDHPAQPRHRATPELWFYLRGHGQRRELVCKVFDSFPGWLRGNVPGRGNGRAPADALSGRGLEVVHELSQGRWGHHPTRSRLAVGGPRQGRLVLRPSPSPSPGRERRPDRDEAAGHAGPVRVDVRGPGHDRTRSRDGRQAIGGQGGQGGHAWPGSITYCWRWS